ncbi:MAG: MBL fold metallo-hydrolase [Methanobacterium sp.]|nr:MBL fold metallo-hydrolase [Methanobacterium sp.]
MTVVLKWFPPSWIQIKYENSVIYIDPAYLKTFYKDYPHKIEFSTWPDDIDGLPEEKLQKADIILVTHEHKDHCKQVTVKRLIKKYTRILAPEICKKELGDSFDVVKAGEIYHFEDIKVEVVPAYNTPEGHSTKKFHKKGKGVGYLINIQDKTIYHAGDTDFISEMREFGPVDVALIPIGGTFTMDIEEAVEAVMAIKPEYVIPMHMKDADPYEFKQLVEEKSNIKVIPLVIGGILELE